MLLTAFLVTTVVFLVGLYVGYLLDDLRISGAGMSIIDTEIDTDSFIVQRGFFETFGVKDCDLFTDRMQKLGDDLGKIGNTLARYDAKKISKGDYYNQLKKKYFLLEILVYTLRKDMQDKCGQGNSNVFLFFYDTENNQESLNQGYVLDTIVKETSNVVVFSFDKNFNETALKSLVDYYNVSVSPTIILNFKQKFEGYVSKEVLYQHLRK